MNMKIKMIIILSLFLSLNFIAKENKSCTNDHQTFRCVEYLKVYDADSITVRIKNIHPLFGGGQKGIAIRVLGVDTPEIRGKTLCEKLKAKEARDYVRSLLKKAKRIDVENVSRGKYFRVVGNVIIDGKSLTSKLLAKGYAYPYYGRTKKKVDWCKPLRSPASN